MIEHQAPSQWVLPLESGSNRINPRDTATIKAVAAFRNEAVALRAKVAKGSYGPQERIAFGRLAGGAGLTLAASNPQLSERAGLGPSYFSTVSGRNPKLANMLKALSAMIDVADERLASITADDSQERAAWVPNPLRRDPARLQRVQATLLELLEHLKASNSLSEFIEVDTYWRTTLIDLLETVSEILKAPLIERSLLEKAIHCLHALSAKVADHAVSSFVGGLAGAAATALIDLLSK